MSGILGVWNLDGRPLERASLSKLGATIAHRGPDAYDSWVDGPVGLACHLLRVTPESAIETQPVIGASRVVAVFDGRLDNREELLASLPVSPRLNASSPDPDIVVAAYENFGEHFTERLNGDFALGLFDPGRQKLVLARDAIGVRPLYYCWTANRKTFLFASEIKALLAHPEVSTQPNPDALADLLLGCRVLIPQGITCFQGVHSVPPSHVATLTAGEFKTRRYWDFDPAARIRLGSFPEYAEAFRERFETAVRRRLRSSHPVAVAISGGLDSSAVFCMAQKLRTRSPQIQGTVVGLSQTFPEGSRCDEQHYLTEIERDYDCEITRIPMGPPGFVEGCEAQIWHHEAPRLDLVWNNVETLLGFVRHLGARVLLTGHFGDEILFDQNWFPGLMDADPQYFRRMFFRDLAKACAPDWLLPPLRRLRSKVASLPKLQSWYTQAFRTRVLPPVSPRPKREFATAHGWSLYQTARSGYYGACIEWHSKSSSLFGTQMAYPFMDRDLISFLMAIPGDVQVHNGVPKGILRESLRGVLPAAIAGRRGKADFTARVNEGVDRQLPQLLRWLEPSPLTVKFGYVEKNGAGAIVKELKTGKPRQDALLSWALRDVLALEVWLQIFFGDRRADEVPGTVLLTNANMKLAGVTE
jgi:asparagine synthase (glutamine-hydrolysing)